MPLSRFHLETMEYLTSNQYPGWTPPWIPTCVDYPLRTRSQKKAFWRAFDRWLEHHFQKKSSIPRSPAHPDPVAVNSGHGATTRHTTYVTARVVHSPRCLRRPMPDTSSGVHPSPPPKSQVEDDANSQIQSPPVARRPVGEYCTLCMEVHHGWLCTSN